MTTKLNYSNLIGQTMLYSNQIDVNELHSLYYARK